MRLLHHVIDVNGVGQWNLYPFGDLQFGASGFNENLWRELSARIRKDPRAITIGMGDYSDHWRPTNQARMANALTGDAEFARSIDEMYMHHQSEIIRKVGPVVKPGRCLGLLSGHHEYTFSSGLNSTADLAERVGAPWLRRSTMIVLDFKAGTQIWRMKIHAQHGDGGSAYLSTDMTHLERKTAPHWNADLFLRGHSTKKYAGSIIVLDVTEPKGGIPLRLIEQEKVLVNTGGFMKGYLDDEDTYVERKNMPPAHLGYCVVHLTLQRHRATTNYKSNYIKITVTH